MSFASANFVTFSEERPLLLPKNLTISCLTTNNVSVVTLSSYASLGTLFFGNFFLPWVLSPQLLELPSGTPGVGFLKLKAFSSSFVFFCATEHINGRLGLTIDAIPSLTAREA